MQFKRVEQIINDLIAQEVFPCAAAEIGNKEGPVWQYVAGVRQIIPAPLPVNQETLFDMASVSKVMSVTTIVLTLLENGVFSLEDTLGLFWKGLNDIAARITLHQLLTHTSGLPGGASIVGCNRNQLAQTILSLPPAYPAGTRSQYACLGFLVLGELLELVTGKTLDVLARQLVFEPLHMTKTGYAPKGTNIASTNLTDKEVGIVNDYNARYMARPVGNAGLFSNLTDCGAFCRMLLNNGAPILASSTLAVANQDYTPFCGDARGLGFYRFRRKENPVCEICSPLAFGHSGWTGTSIMVDVEAGFYLTLLTNRTCVKSLDERQIWRARRLVHNTAVATYAKATKPSLYPAIVDINDRNVDKHKESTE